MTDHIRVVIANDHRLFREGLRLMLARDESIDVVDEAANRVQAIDLVRDLQPDVVLLDIVLREIYSMEVFRQIREESPETKPLVVIPPKEDETVILKALKLGAKGYLSKDATVSDLIKAIRTVYQGDVWVERKLITRFFDTQDMAHFQGEQLKGSTKKELTPREQEVLRCLTKGSTNKEIGQALFISEKTVKSHLNSIFRKLNVTRRLQAILYAIRLGLQ